jgi:hypothetical protein
MPADNDDTVENHAAAGAESTATKDTLPAETIPGLAEGNETIDPHRHPQATTPEIETGPALDTSSSGEPSSPRSALQGQGPIRSASPARTESSDVSYIDLSSLGFWSVPPETYEAWARINETLAADSSALSIGPGYPSYTPDIDSVPAFLMIEVGGRKLREDPGATIARMQYLSHRGFSFHGNRELFSLFG